MAWNRFAGSVAAAALLSALSTPVIAQQITTEVRGSVEDPNGLPVANAEIQVVDTRTNRTRTARTSSRGSFVISNLEPGGPYSVFVTAEGFQGQTVQDINLSVANAANLNFDLRRAGDIEEVLVVAQANVLSRLAIGPSSSFGLETLQNLPSISRDLRDTIRLDPRVTIDEGGETAFSCLGGNPDTNGFTIDGVQTADPFGLNVSGFPNRNSIPIPFDSIAETSVEFSPFDVTYGQFTGCIVNVVTKQGSNEFHGSFFNVYNSDNLQGNSIDGDEITVNNFNDFNWGAELGGPIIKDKLFFYVAYEETRDGDIQVDGPLDAGFAETIDITADNFLAVGDVIEQVYGLETGGIQSFLPESSRRILTRWDWFITDNHRAAFTYTRLREENLEPDDFFGSNITFANTFEIEGSEVETYSFRLFSDWTDNFSTDIRISRQDNIDLQNPQGGGEAQDALPIPRFEIEVPGEEDPADTVTIINGPGFFRSANFLQTQTDQIRVKADYRLNRHTLTAGYELNQLDVFNLFIPNAVGTIEFDFSDQVITDEEGNVLGPDFDAITTMLAQGMASAFDINASFAAEGSGTALNPGAAAADFSRSIHSLYVQDQFQATPNLLILLGLRYDFYTTNDAPALSQAFVDRFGFENTTSFGEFDIFLPRLGVTYDAPWDFFGQTTFKFGAGVFTGGDPTVFFSNAFSNFGGGIGFGDEDDAPCTAADLNVVAGGAFTGFPDCAALAAAAQAQQGLGQVDAIAPGTDIPSVIRGSFGFTHITDFRGALGGFFDNWNIAVDVIHSRRRNDFDVRNITISPTPLLAPDGRPILNAIDPLQEGCDATFAGIEEGFTGPADQLVPGGACDAGGDDIDTVLFNSSENGRGTNVSLLFNKNFNYEVLGKPGNFRFNFGYAYTTNSDVNPLTSSTAASNSENASRVVVTDPILAPSFNNREHNITISAFLDQQWTETDRSSIGMFFRATSGRPYSLVFQNDAVDGFFGDADDESRLLIPLPTGVDDARFDFSGLDAGELSDLNDLLAFIETEGAAADANGFALRNQLNDPFTFDLDLRFSHETAGFFDGHTIRFFMDINNFLNLIDDGANLFEEFDRGNTPEGVEVISLADLDGANVPAALPVTAVDAPELQVGLGASLWQVQLGIQYRF